MNPVLDALQEAVAGAAERVGPAVVGLGRGWGRGSGVVIDGGTVLTAAHVRLGVALAPPRAARRMRAAVGLPERDGLLVREVADDSPAARAGLQRGDLLVAAGGRPPAAVDDPFHP